MPEPYITWIRKIPEPEDDMSTTPEACEVCGREPKVGIAISAGWLVTCESCGIHSWPQESREKAIEAWNRRTT